jgi:hypothetical protein
VTVARLDPREMAETMLGEIENVLPLSRVGLSDVRQAWPEAVDKLARALLAEADRADALEAELERTRGSEQVFYRQAKESNERASALEAELARKDGAIRACIGDAEGQEAVAPGSRKILTLTNGQARMLAAALAEPTGEKE